MISYTRYLLFVFLLVIGETLALDRLAYACEGMQVSLLCGDTDKVISVTSARYGRFSRNVCLDNDSHDYSHIFCSQNQTNVVSALCSGRFFCQVPVNSNTFRNPCPPNVYKHAEITYTCSAR
ncbi:L-rhamnose-binding lectin ELEL-1-like [Biomphalaria glabrata]|uniref:L-rhamnose-binding lectin ELEL-1-like n=1 Tax=Biomphalaria glabrata TaxID=6526 RepID=A0A9W3AH46_BIOGL|nr:L-rhamnose-binding lectin ELEL-1-like [Biomphalaria glabrata]